MSFWIICERELTDSLRTQLKRVSIQSVFIIAKVMSKERGACSLISWHQRKVSRTLLLLVVVEQVSEIGKTRNSTGCEYTNIISWFFCRYRPLMEHCLLVTAVAFLDLSNFANKINVYFYFVETYVKKWYFCVLMWWLFGKNNHWGYF